MFGREGGWGTDCVATLTTIIHFFVEVVCVRVQCCLSCVKVPVFVGYFIYFVFNFGTSKKNDQVHFVCACVQYEAVSLNRRAVQSVICNKDCIK